MDGSKAVELWDTIRKVLEQDYKTWEFASEDEKLAWIAKQYGSWFDARTNR